MIIKQILKNYFKDSYIFIFYKLMKIKRSEKKESVAINRKIDFYKLFLNKGDLCFDVGANIGNKSDLFLKIGCNIVAIEPQKYCSRFLHLRFSNHLEVVKKALSFENGRGEIITSDADTVSTMSVDWLKKMKRKRFQNLEWDKTESVEVTTLDNLISLYGVPKYIKIDVEGYELNVIKGLNQPVEIISFEVNFPESNKITYDCIKELKKLGEFVCNYALGEVPKYILYDWLKPDDFLNHLKMNQTDEMPWGDIYIKFI